MSTQQHKVSTLEHVIQKKHIGKWVGLSMDFKKVLGYSDDVTSLVKKLGRDEITYMKIRPPEANHFFIR